jgi:hypothetical protein
MSNDPGYLPSCCWTFALRFEWYGLQLAVLLEKDFDFPFGLLEFFAARRGKLHAFFK